MDSDLNWDNLLSNARETMVDQFLTNVSEANLENPAAFLATLAQCLEEFPSSKNIRCRCFELLNRFHAVIQFSDEEFLYWHREALITMHDHKINTAIMSACLEFFCSLDESRRYMVMDNKCSDCLKDVVAICMSHTHSRSILLFGMRIIHGVLKLGDSALPGGVDVSLTHDLLRNATETLETFVTSFELVCASMSVITCLHKLDTSAVVNSDASSMMIQVMVMVLQEQVRHDVTVEISNVVAQTIIMLQLLCTIGTTQLLSAFCDHSRILLLCRALFCLMQSTEYQKEFKLILITLSSVSSILSLLDGLFKSQSILMLVVEDVENPEQRNLLVARIRKYLSNSLKFDKIQRNKMFANSGDVFKPLFDQVRAEYVDLLNTLDGISPHDTDAYLADVGLEKFDEMERVEFTDAELKFLIGDAFGASDSTDTGGVIKSMEKMESMEGNNGGKGPPHPPQIFDTPKDSVQEHEISAINSTLPSEHAVQMGENKNEANTGVVVTSNTELAGEIATLTAQLKQLKEQADYADSRASSSHKLFVKSANKVKVLYDQNLRLRQQVDGYERMQKTYGISPSNMPSPVPPSPPAGRKEVALKEYNSPMPGPSPIHPASWNTVATQTLNSFPMYATDISLVHAHMLMKENDDVEGVERETCRSDAIAKYPYKAITGILDALAGISRNMTGDEEPFSADMVIVDNRPIVQELAHKINALYTTVKYTSGESSSARVTLYEREAAAAMSIGCITIMSMNSCLQSLDLLNTSHHAPSNVDTLMAELDSYTVNKKMFLDSEQKTRVVSVQDCSYILVLYSYKRFALSPVELITKLIALLDLSQEKYLLSYREAAREGVPCSIIPGSVPSAKGASNKLHLHIPVNVDSTKIVEEIYVQQQLKAAHSYLLMEKKILRCLYSAYVHREDMPPPSTNVEKLEHPQGQRFLMFDCLVMFAKDFELCPTIISKEQLLSVAKQVCSTGKRSPNGVCILTRDTHHTGHAASASAVHVGYNNQLLTADNLPAKTPLTDDVKPKLIPLDATNVTLNFNQFSAVLLKISLLYFGLSPKKKGLVILNDAATDKKIKTERKSYVKCLVELFMWLNASNGRAVLKQLAPRTQEPGSQEPGPFPAFARSIDAFNASENKKSET